MQSDLNRLTLRKMPPFTTTDTIDSIYRNHRSWLVTWILSRVDCRHTASDLSQDVFVRLLGRNGQDVINTPRAYLAKIAHGLLIDQQRRQAIERAWLESFRHIAATEAPAAEEHALMIDALTRIDMLLDGLKPRARQAFLMSRLEGTPYLDIAKSMNVSVSTVEKDIAHALRHVYRALMG